MDFSELGPLSVDCLLCGKPIKQKHQATAVMVRVWVPQIGQYRAEGPFHEACGKLRNERAASTTQPADRAAVQPST